MREAAFSMAEPKSMLFARLLGKLNPRLTFGLIGSSLFLFLIALSNLFSAYYAIAEADVQSMLLRIMAILFYAVPASGILMMKRWARLLGIFVAMTASLLGVLTFLAISNLDGAFIVITHGAVLLCLLSKKTRAAFAIQAG